MVADFLADLKAFGTVLMGRKTYAVGLQEGKTSPYPATRQILFSQSMTKSPDKSVELVRENMTEFVQALKSEADQPIWLCGGGDVASSLMRAGLIDNVVVKLYPVVFGSGISLFASLTDYIGLELQETKAYGCGIVLLRYSVQNKVDAT